MELKFGEAASSDEDRKHVHRVPHPVREREATSNVSDDPKRYKNYYTDEYYSKKPEFMTQIRADLLVFKDDPRIIFRGRIDSLEAEMLRGMLLMRHEKNADLFKGLKDIYLHLRKDHACGSAGRTHQEFQRAGEGL